MNHVADNGGRGPRYWRRLLPLVAMLTLGLVVTGAGAASAATPAVPFKASLSGTVALSGATFELHGTGKASHLGSVKSYTANGAFTGPNSNSLTETLTAANGDTLTFACDEVFVETSPGVLHGTDTWTVIGGTGRFSNATGSGTAEADADLNVGALTFTKEITGTISY